MRESEIARLKKKLNDSSGFEIRKGSKRKVGTSALPSLNTS